MPPVLADAEGDEMGAAGAAGRLDGHSPRHARHQGDPAQVQPAGPLPLAARAPEVQQQ